MALTLLLSSQALAGSAGTLDPEFGTGGIVETNLGPQSTESAVGARVLADGRIVVGGSTSQIDTGVGQFVALRYLSSGLLDETFGSGGSALIPFAYDVFATDMAMQPNGRIVVAGQADIPAGQDTKGAIALARVLPDGQVDTSFSGDGRRVARFSRDSANVIAMSLAPGGKIVVLVNSGPFAGVARFNANGALDTTFNGSGRAAYYVGPNGGGRDVTVQSDGKIIVAGNSSDADFLLLRFNADGSHDTTFGTNGRVETQIGLGSFARAVAVDPVAQTIVAAGNSANDSEEDVDDLALARYLASGALDPTFGNGGIVTTNARDIEEWNSLAIEADGSIVAAGVASLLNTTGIILGRYLVTGAPDGSFGQAGIVTVELNGRTSTNDVTIQPDHKIIVSGGHTIQTFVETNILLARFLG
jgi:uncharacterized delta-60 repeat protein